MADSASRARAQHADKDPDIVPVCVIESNCVACLSTRRLRAFQWDIYQNTRPEFGTLYVKVMTFLFYACYFSHRQDSFAVSFISIGPVSKELWLF